jgi:hypothetical protein
MGGQGVSAKDVSGTLYENVAETARTTLSLSKDPQARGISSFGAEAANRLKKNGVQVNPGAEDGSESVPSSQTKAERPIARLAAAAGTLRWSFSKSKAGKHHAPEVIGSEPDVVDSVPSVEVPSVEAATPISGSMASTVTVRLSITIPSAKQLLQKPKETPTSRHCLLQVINYRPMVQVSHGKARSLPHPSRQKLESSNPRPRRLTTFLVTSPLSWSTRKLRIV